MRAGQLWRECQIRESWVQRIPTPVLPPPYCPVSPPKGPRATVLVAVSPGGWLTGTGAGRRSSFIFREYLPLESERVPTSGLGPGELEATQQVGRILRRLCVCSSVTTFWLPCFQGGFRHLNLFNSLCLGRLSYALLSSLSTVFPLPLPMSEHRAGSAWRKVRRVGSWGVSAMAVVPCVWPRHTSLVSLHFLSFYFLKNGHFK